MSSRNPSQPYVNGHPSRRDNNSISSTTSSSSNRNERGSSQRAKPAVESAVTRLLVSIKALLESLTLWSQQRVDEGQVSDVYVRLGNDFNAAVAAFAAFNIDMAELLAVPEDLRTILEQCLAEDATPENLEIYLPQVRAIITNLLQGLRAKQTAYQRTSSRSERSDKSSRREGSHRSQLSRSIPEEERQDAAGSGSRRSAQSSSGRSRRDMTPQAATVQHAEEPFVGGFSPNLGEQAAAPLPPVQPDTHGQRSTMTPPAVSSPTPPESTLSETPNNSTATIQESKPEPPPNQAAAPASMKRYSLVDKPASPIPLPTFQIEPSSPDPSQVNGTSSPSTESIPLDPPPAVANSLAALKKNDVLERRASKRFSVYNISKMTGASTTRERSLRNHPHRRSMAANTVPTPNELAVLTEVDDEESEVSLKQDPSRPATPELKREASIASRRAAAPSLTPEPAVVADRSNDATQEATPSRIAVFLQLGREVKKVTIEPPLTFPSLRVLFVDKFSYNPGQENFPAIYIRDPSSGVQYELEDVEEVKDKCLLSLNIEPLDQIKQHIDSQISTLSQDLKDLKTAVTNSQRHPSALPDIVAHPLAESTPMANRPSDRQFQHVARRLSRFVGDSSMASIFAQQPNSPPPPTLLPQMTGQSLQSQMTGASVMSEYSSRVVTDLKTQFDEVQNLRRDLGILRQMYTEFMKQTKDTLGTLRTQTQSVKQLANTNVGGARAYIDSGKKKLDVRSQDVLTDVEKLQDTVERVKDDVIKRNTTPKPQFFKNIKKDIDATAAELQSLKEHIKTIKPMWKQTWEEELQNIVEEQQFLVHQEDFLNDLLEDHKAVLEIYGHVEKIVNLRGPQLIGQGRLRSRTFQPPPPEQGHSGLSTVMLEIRGAAIDPEKRLKAIEENQRNRELERAGRGDDLQVELAEFVEGKKLKMTGGAEEVERLRQKKNEQTLRAMFSSGNASPSYGSDMALFGSEPPPS